jgi:D-sedoheptulose 7-phosphate isomerase
VHIGKESDVGTREAAVSGTSETLRELARIATEAADGLEAPARRAAERIIACFQGGGKILACGNGGSAADAQHFVAEFVGHMCRERRSLPAIALSSDPSIVTAIANDYGYEKLFARQVEGLGKRGDVLVAISTSGRSRNVLAAVDAARRLGLSTVALLGAGGDPAFEACDVVLRVPSQDTQRIQEIHTAILHSLCDAVDRAFVSESS